VIGLDVKLNSPDEEGKTRSTSSRKITLPVDEEYVEETVELCEAIKKVAQLPAGPKIVLARSMRVRDHVYDRASDVYDGFGFGTGKVSFGFLNLDDEDCRCVTPL